MKAQTCLLTVALSLLLRGTTLAGDWPGGWTQTYAQIDTEAGTHGFDKDYFVQQVAGLSQLAGELMQVAPLTIDLGWGALKSALAKLDDKVFAVPAEAKAQRQALVEQYEATFRTVEAGRRDAAREAIKGMAADVAARIVPERQAAITTLIEGQRAKLG